MASGDGYVCIESDGHAPTRDGHDSAPCAVVSTLVRAFGETVAQRRDCLVSGDAPHPGRFVAEVRARNRRARRWLSGVAAVTARQFALAAAAYPDQILYEYVEEQIDGT